MIKTLVGLSKQLLCSRHTNISYNKGHGPPVYVWNNSFSFDSDPWSILFYLKYPTIAREGIDSLQVINNKVLAFSVFKTSQKFTKGARREHFHLSWSEAMRICMLDMESSQSVRFSKEVSGSSSSRSLTRTIQFKVTPNFVALSISQGQQTMSQIQNYRFLAISIEDFMVLQSAILGGSNQLSGLYEKFNVEFQQPIAAEVQQIVRQQNEYVEFGKEERGLSEFIV